MNSTKEKLKKLTEYIEANPSQRFWQAVSNCLISPAAYIGTADRPDGKGFRDLFYEE